MNIVSYVTSQISIIKKYINTSNFMTFCNFRIILYAKVRYSISVVTPTKMVKYDNFTFLSTALSDTKKLLIILIIF